MSISYRRLLQEAQLMLTTGSTRLAVSRGQQTWYIFRGIFHGTHVTYSFLLCNSNFLSLTQEQEADNRLLRSNSNSNHIYYILAAMSLD